MIKWTIAVLACLAVLGGLAAYKLSEIRDGMAAAAAFPEPSETVDVATVTSMAYRPELAVVGEVVAPQRLDLRNEIAGEIVEVNFASGAAVASGQILIRLDTSVEEANLAAARARADLAALVFDRQRELFDDGLSNAEQLDRARADLAIAEAEIGVLERTMEKMTLRAPFAGRAGLHSFEVGQFLPSNTLITSLIGNTDHMWVDFQVPQFYRQLPVGTEVGVTTISDEKATARVPATVIAENTVLSARNRSRGYRARIPGGASEYAANTVVDVSLPTGRVEQLLRVPAVAVQNDPLGQFVFRLTHEDGSLRAGRQPVTVRLVTNDYALLETGTGLAEGDRVAGAGAFKLYEGILVVPGSESPTESEAYPVYGPPG